jgi:hypothetical protein
MKTKAAFKAKMSKAAKRVAQGKYDKSAYDSKEDALQAARDEAKKELGLKRQQSKLNLHRWRKIQELTDGDSVDSFDSIETAATMNAPPSHGRHRPLVEHLPVIHISDEEVEMSIEIDDQAPSEVAKRRRHKKNKSHHPVVEQAPIETDSEGALEIDIDESQSSSDESQERSD